MKMKMKLNLVCVLTSILGALSFPTVSSPLNTRDVIPNVVWTIKSLTRTCNSNFVRGCAYDFDISQNDNSPDFNCKIYDRKTSPEDPAKQSFYAVPCNRPVNPDGGWVISWGYNDASNSAVMTVVNKDKKRIAWFGWGDITKQNNFPDVGPYAVNTI